MEPRNLINKSLYSLMTSYAVMIFRIMDGDYVITSWPYLY